MIDAVLESWRENTAAGWKWWVDPALLEHGFEAPGAALERAIHDRRAEVVKQGPHRVVYRLKLGPGQSIYVKHNLVANTRAWLRQLVRPSKARMEMDAALHIAARGVATFEPLALGEHQTPLGACASYLVTRGLENTEPLNAFMACTLIAMREPRRTRTRLALARSLGSFLARMHDAGIRHDDLHAANVLVRLDAEDQPDLFLIDLQAARLGPALAWAAARENLAIFTRWFIPRASRADRLRFWEAYCENRRPGSIAVETTQRRAVAIDLEKYSWDSMRVFCRNRDARCTGNNRYYRRVRGPGVAGHALTHLDGVVVRQFLADPDAPFRWPQTRFLKKSRGSWVAEIEVELDGSRTRLIYKRFNVTHWARPWLALFRSTSALRCWILGHGFRERCLPTARPLVVLERVVGPGAREGYLLAEKVENAVDLHGFLERLQELPADRARMRLRLGLAALGRLLARLHRHRLDHRDLKASNVLVEPELEKAVLPFAPVDAASAGAAIASHLPLPASPFWFIDLVGVTRHARLSRARRVRNLTRLHASFHESRCLTRSDKLRFLRAYMAWNLGGRGSWKEWWRAIAKATARKVTLNARRGRVLA
jgi:tRNA A-37 threonylcarbamoyl transferase component Bud32